MSVAAVLVLALTLTGANAAPGSARAPLQGGAARKQAEQDGIDIDRLIQTVRHRVAPSRARSGPLVSGHQILPSIVFGGANYLIVWQDGRGTFYDIYAARVSPGGTVLDPGGIAISTAAREQLEPKVAFDGTNYLVAWTDYRSESNTDIYAARVSPAGAVLDPGGIAISTVASYQGSPALAFDGTNYLVAWSENDAIRGARVSPAGAVLEPGGFAISTGSDPALAFDGTNYLAAWNQNGYDIYGARISPAGSVLDPGGIAISTAEGFRDVPALAFNGENYLVEWQEHQSAGFWDIYGARVSPSGTVLDPGGIAISTAAYNQQASTVASDGANCLVAWQDSRTGTGWDIDGGRVSPTGTVLDPGGIAITTVGGGQMSPALAFDGGNYFVAWQGHRSTWDRIYGARVSPAGAVLDPNGIEISPDLPPPPPPPPPPPQPPPPPPSARCRVPRVIGLRLGAAKRKIRQRHCGIGRIRRAHSRRVGRVIRQSPRPGAIKRRDYRVALVVGRR